MQRYILTGAPSAGKTALLRLLERRGQSVIEEAATDVNALALARGVAEPWTAPGFIDDIVALQIQRQGRATGAVQFFDRSPICTWALAVFLGLTPSPALVAEVERIERLAIYQRRIGFVQNLGFCTPTEVRRISFEDSLRFETVHAEAYRRFGYDCVMIAPGPIDARCDRLLAELGLL